jgi:hypothetical protein
MYNLIAAEDCRKSFLGRGAISLIFRLADTGEIGYYLAYYDDLDLYSRRFDIGSSSMFSMSSYGARVHA